MKVGTLRDLLIHAYDEGKECDRARFLRALDYALFSGEHHINDPAIYDDDSLINLVSIIKDERKRGTINEL